AGMMHHTNDNDREAKILCDLSIAYNSNRETEKAKKVLSEALQLNNLKPKTELVILSGLAETELFAGNYAGVISSQGPFETAYKKWRVQNDFNEAEGNKYSSAFHQTLAIAQYKTGKYAAAEINFTKAIDFAGRAYASPNVREFAKIYIPFADMYAGQKMYDRALFYYQKAMHTVIPSADSSDYFRNPDTSFLYPENVILESLDGKSHVFREMYKMDSSLRFLKTALACDKIAMQVERELRRTYDYETSKLMFNALSRSRHESAMQSAWTLYEITKDTAFLNDAFYISENSKYNVLQEGLQKNQAARKSLPDSLQNTLKNLHIEMNDINTALRAERNKSEMNDFALVQLEQQKFLISQQLDSIKYYFKMHYPQYYKLTADASAATLSETKESLKRHPGTCMISFFTADSTTYLFYITADTTVFKNINYTGNMDSIITKYKKYLAQPGAISSQNDFFSFAETGTHLFTKYFSTLSELKNIQNLIVIADETFAYLPFESLVINASHQGSFEQVKYLLDNYIISYAFSASLWQQSTEYTDHEAQAIFAGFAPAFQQDDNKDVMRDCLNQSLGNLRYNSEEITSIQNTLGGDDYLSSNATSNNFLEYARNYKILHLATHACADDTDPSNCRIYFSDRSITSDELYFLNINAQLVTLSACNTGTGKLQSGEGVMSLSRAFVYAGCPSIVMSLWSVDDRSTGQLMNLFYTELKNGKNKDEALRQAKLKYLQTADKAHQHPYYWAAFIQSGDTAPIEMHKEKYTLAYLITGFAVFIATFMLIRRVRKRHPSKDHFKLS
ncbi:MAG: CHAT domain-containing protein, partial [Chitinophagales bacterium]|nr:CHAT domain-containing protein [Chitinophagales bacterium]